MGIMMTNDFQNVVNKDWIFAHVLRDDGLSHTEQITFLLFLKMVDLIIRQSINRLNREDHAYAATT